MRASSRLFMRAWAKGANIAAWRQAASAELANARGLNYAQAHLDLAKAFDRAPHHILIL